MHILYLHQYFCPPGGSGNDRSYEFAREWVKAGHRVSMITGPAYFPHDIRYDVMRTPNKNYWYSQEGIEVTIIPEEYSHMMGFMQRYLAFARFFAKGLPAGKKIEKPDRIYASSTPLTIGEMGRKLSRFHQVPFVFETVDVWPDVPIDMGVVRNPLLKWRFRRMAKNIYQSAAHIVALSPGMKQQILQSGAVEPGKITVIPNGTNPEKFPFRERPSAERTHVVYTGTVGMANDLTRLVNAALILQKKGRNDIHFTVLGNGNDKARVTEVARKTAVNNITFLEGVPKEEVGKILDTAHIGVVCFAAFPSLEANSANKFYDYLASGLPVVINYKGWQAEVLEKYQCGLSAKQGDDAGFAAAIESLAENSALRRQMGINGRALAVDQYDRRKLAKETLEIILRSRALR